MSVIHNLNRRSLAGFLLVLSISSLIFVSLPARAFAAPTGPNFDHVLTPNVADSTGKTFTTSQPLTVLPASTGGSTITATPTWRLVLASSVGLASGNPW